MKVFVDIGAYNGDTLDLALKYGYNEIHCLEPAKKHHLILAEKADIPYPHIHIHEHALGLKYQKTALYGAGSDGATVFKGKKVAVNSVETVEVFPAGDWFKVWTKREDQVHVKINVEGAEIPILNDLINTNQIHRVKELCVFYDCMKVPGHEQFMPMMERKLSRYPHLLDREIAKPPGIRPNFVRNWFDKINKP